MELPAAPTSDGIVIQVRLTPKSNAARIAGAEHYGDKPVLKAHVTAPPEDGKANAALTVLIAGWLGVPKSKVTVASGQKSRLKTVAVDGNPLELMAKVELLLSAEEPGKGQGRAG
jgi:uncharacterized protein (TIGR00251 family)